MLLLQSNQHKIMSEQAIKLLREQFGPEITASAIHAVAAQMNSSYATISKYLQMYKVGRGKWNLEVTQEKINELEETYNAPSVSPISIIEKVNQNLIPEKDDTFVSFGNFNDVKKIIQSNIFYPTFITGLCSTKKGIYSC